MRRLVFALCFVVGCSSSDSDASAPSDVAGPVASGGSAGAAGHGGAGKGGSSGASGTSAAGGAHAGGASGAGGAHAGGASGNGGTHAGGASGSGGTHAGGAAGTAGSSGGGAGGTSTGGSSNAGTGGTSSAGSGGIAGSAGATSTPGPSSSRQTAKPLGTTAAANGYWEYLPPTYGDGSQYPLLVFWHGIGEDGDGSATDLPKVLVHGPPMLIAKDAWPNDRPFVVLSPQNPGSGCPASGEIHDFLAYAASSYAIDPKRVYLTGLSCGAIGSWQYLGDDVASQVAAAVLMSGDPGPVDQSWSTWGKQMCNLGALAIWAFHGDQDTTVSIANEENTMNDLLACPMPPRRDAKWTVIAGGGHAIWDPIYDLSAGYPIYDFLLQNAKP